MPNDFKNYVLPRLKKMGRMDILNSADKRGLTPLHLISQNERTAFSKVLVPHLIEEQLTHAEIVEGKSPLHYAVVQSSPDVALLLIEKISEMKRLNLSDKHAMT